MKTVLLKFGCVAWVPLVFVLLCWGASANAATLTVVKAGNGAGTVALSPSAATYASGTVVTVTATPAAGSGFAGWSDGATGTNKSVKVTITSNIVVTATFTAYTLTVVKAGTGAGTVALSPSAATYASGTVVTVTATPTAGSGFAGWSGGATGTNKSVKVTITGNITVTATFTAYTLTVVKAGTGVGTVALSPSAATYASGTVVTVTATPAAGSGFADWSGGATGTNKSVKVTITGNITVTADFADTQHPTVTITAPTAAQRIVTNGPFVARGTATDNSRVSSVWVQVNSAGWTSAAGTNAWSLAVPMTPGSNTVRAYSRDAAGNHSTTASVACTYVVMGTLMVHTNGLGTVTRAPVAAPEVGQTYTLTATPAAGYAFVNWTDSLGGFLSTGRILVVVMPSNLVLRANFLSAAALSAAGVSSLSTFFNDSGDQALDPSLVASAVTNFGLAAVAAPANYTNRIYNAVAILLNLANDPALRSRAEAYGVNLDNLLAPTCVFPSSGAPAVNGSVDVLASSVLPVVSRALTELASVPATWTGLVEISPADYTNLQESVWVDVGDVTAVKAACEWLKACIELLQAYNLNADLYQQVDKSTLLSVLRAGNPEFLSSVRNSSSLASVKTDLQGAVTDYLAADTLIVNRNSTNAALLHVINLDPASAADEENLRTIVTDIQTGLSGGAVSLNVDPDIETTGKETVYLAKFFSTPYIFTNKLPSGLTGTLENPGWTTFPDPTFNGMFPNVTNAKLDKFLRWNSLPIAAPASLSGRTVWIMTDGGDQFEICFGASTYVQGGDWFGAIPGSAGNYTYTKTATNAATLVLTCTVPPLLAGSLTETLTFTGNSGHEGTYVGSDAATGTFRMSLQDVAAPASLAGINVQVEMWDGPGQLAFTSSGKWMQIGASGYGAASGGTYTYTKYAPAGAMVVSKDDGGDTHYSVLLFDVGNDPVLTLSHNSGDVYVSNADASEVSQGYFQEVASMTVSSSGFSNGGAIPKKYAHSDGIDSALLNYSPPLTWTTPPSGTQSFAVLAADMDGGGFSHWVLYNLPAGTRSLAQNLGSGENLPNGAVQGRNDYSEIGYGGPMPPSGQTHHYVFMVLALDTMIDNMGATFTQSDLENAIDGHVLGLGVLTGTYTGP